MLHRHREPDPSVEYDLLKLLIGLPQSRAPGLELSALVRLLVEAMAATTGYVELVTGEDATLWFSTGHDVLGNDPVDVISRGTIERAIAEEEVIESSSARTDPRLRDLPTVRREQIEALVCAPLDFGPLRGALCVQRSRSSGAFSPRHLVLVELFTEQLAQVASRLEQRTRRTITPLRDEMRRFQQALVREALAQAGGNVAKAARELKVARSFLYTLAEGGQIVIDRAFGRELPDANPPSRPKLRGSVTRR